MELITWKQMQRNKKSMFLWHLWKVVHDPIRVYEDTFPPWSYGDPAGSLV